MLCVVFSNILLVLLTFCHSRGSGITGGQNYLVVVLVI